MTVAKLLAPFCPFIADEIYDNLDGAEPSVHLCDFPDARRARDARARAGDGGRPRDGPRSASPPAAQAKIKVRQPLRRGGRRRRRRASARRSSGWPSIVREELNVTRAALRLRGRRARQLELKPNYRTLGPRFGKQMPLVAAAVAALDPAHVAAALRDGRTRGDHASAASDHELGADDLLVAMKPLEGYQVEREGSHAVALELEIDDELRAEGWAREIVHAVQNARKDAGLEVDGPDRADARRRRRRCSPPRARTRTTSPARRSRVEVGYESLDGDREPVDDRRAPSCGSAWRWLRPA